MLRGRDGEPPLPRLTSPARPARSVSQVGWCTAHRPPLDTIVRVDLKLPNGDRLQGEALVVHVVDDSSKGGVGLAFLSDDSTFAETLDRYLASLAG